MRVLAFESSCDETAVAVVASATDGGSRPVIVANVIHSQVNTHALFGGVVPEVASREHLVRIAPLVREALSTAGMTLDDINAVAATRGPGLIGALLVGVQFAKGIAMARGLPFLGMHHLEGHLAAALLSDHPPPYPHLALLVSGGHTVMYKVQSFGEYSVLGGTRDDAAGEAFDKIAKVLGLGYPGGVQIQRCAEGGDAQAIAMPRGIPQKSLAEFSFSGLKTHAAEYIRRQVQPLEGQHLADFCASVQHAIGDILTKKAVYHAHAQGLEGVVLAGGVAANTHLRDLLEQRCAARGLWSFVPERALCTDNAAMIGAAAWMRMRRGESSGFGVPAVSRWPLQNAGDGFVAKGPVGTTV